MEWNTAERAIKTKRDTRTEWKKKSEQARLIYVRNINLNIPTTWRWARGGGGERERERELHKNNNDNNDNNNDNNAYYERSTSGLVRSAVGLESLRLAANDVTLCKLHPFPYSLYRNKPHSQCFILSWFMLLIGSSKISIRLSLCNCVKKNFENLEEEKNGPMD